MFTRLHYTEWMYRRNDPSYEERMELKILPLYIRRKNAASINYHVGIIALV